MKEAQRENMRNCNPEMFRSYSKDKLLIFNVLYLMNVIVEETRII